MMSEYMSFLRTCFFMEHLMWSFERFLISSYVFIVVDIFAPNKGKIWILDHQNYSKRFMGRQAVSKSQIFDLDSQPNYVSEERFD